MASPRRNIWLRARASSFALFLRRAGRPKPFDDVPRAAAARPLPAERSRPPQQARFSADRRAADTIGSRQLHPAAASAWGRPREDGSGRRVVRRAKLAQQGNFELVDRVAARARWRLAGNRLPPRWPPGTAFSLDVETRASRKPGTSVGARRSDGREPVSENTARRPRRSRTRCRAGFLLGGA